MDLDSRATRGSTARQARTLPLYTPEQRQRRDASRWTFVQGVLAPVQFLVFLVSLALVLRFLLTGEGEQAATVSVVVKTLVLYTIMVTGCIWEKDVFGVWLFAPAFYWEDVFSMLVLALHTAYLLALSQGWLGQRQQHQPARAQAAPARRFFPKPSPTPRPALRLDRIGTARPCPAPTATDNNKASHRRETAVR